jgi:hypothetical protein
MQFQDIHSVAAPLPKELLSFFSTENKNAQYAVNGLQYYFPLLDFVQRKKESNHQNIQNTDQPSTWKCKYTLVDINTPSKANSKASVYSPASKLFKGTLRDVATNECQKDIPLFLKFTHVIDPHALVRGHYPDPRAPHISNPRMHKLHHKLSFPFNTAYVDSLASYITGQLVSENTSPHFPNVYGIYHGAAKQHCIEFTEEYRDYCKKKVFQDGLTQNKYMVLKDTADPEKEDEDGFSLETVMQQLSLADKDTTPETTKGTKETTQNVSIDTPYDTDTDNDADNDNTDADNDVENEADNEADHDADNDADHEADHEADNEEDSNSSTDDDTECEGIQELLCLGTLETLELPSRCYSDDEEGGHDMHLRYLQMFNTPVQIVAMEAFSCTMDAVLKKEYSKLRSLRAVMNCDQSYSAQSCWNTWRWYTYQKHFDKKWVGLLLQVCLALVSAQHRCNLVHNDLHTQNVMLAPTKDEFLYYRSYSHYYKVPTHGYVVKIIDMGRATFEIGKTLFMGDVFKRHGEAGEQYTYPHSHYRNNTAAEVKPNKGFDLARLSCSFLDEIYRPGEQPKNDLSSPAQIYAGQSRTTSELFNLLCEWITDKFGKPVNRFQNFDLYKMLARRMTCTTPLYQLRRPHFATYRTSKAEYDVAKTAHPTCCYHITPRPTTDRKQQRQQKSAYHRTNTNPSFLNESESDGDRDDTYFNTLVDSSDEEDFLQQVRTTDASAILHVSPITDLSQLELAS